MQVKLNYLLTSPQIMELFEKNIGFFKGARGEWFAIDAQKH